MVWGGFSLMLKTFGVSVLEMFYLFIFSCLGFWNEACWFLSLRFFWTIVFIFIVISTTFRPICPPAFFRCLSNSGTFTELRTTSFIESTWVACSVSVSRNRVQVLNMANGIRTDNFRGFNKGRSSKFCEGSRVWQTLEEGRRTYRPKHCGNNKRWRQ